ncbi:MAG: hypothetical protein WC073_10975 [Sterolibacterium sp.]
MSETKLALEARIHELEMEVESYRYAANKLACELVSIIVPYRERDPVRTAAAMEIVTMRHPDPRFGKEVH